jgi:hypothetical protein
MGTWEAKGMVGEAASNVHEAPYQGRAGATRTENVHVPLPGGTLRAIPVARVVNAATDPHLRDAALAGTLHRVDGGTELAIPFVLHDPALRKLAIVLPEALRHEQLRERARFLAQVADDPSAPVPAYVADATVVVGPAQLAAYLAQPSAGARRAADEAEIVQKRKEVGAAQQELIAREDALAEREQAVAQREQGFVQREQTLAGREQAVVQREQALVQREQRMRERAEDVTRREDELTIRAEETEAASRELAAREQELVSRLEALAEREASLQTRTAEHERPREQPVHSPAAAAIARPSVSSRPPPSLVVSPVVSPAAVAALSPARMPVVEPLGDDVASLDDVSPADDADDDEIEELDELEPIRTNPGVEPVVATPTSDDRVSIEGDAVEEIVDDDDVEEEVDDDDIEAAPDDAVEETAEVEPDETLIASQRELAAASDEMPGVATGIVPAPGLAPGVEMVALLDEGLTLHVSLGDREDAFAGEAELLVQLAVVEGCPVVVLALVDGSGARPFVRRAAIDPRSPDGRRILELLRRRFEARTVFFGASQELVRQGRVAGPRELNAARTLDRVSRLRGEPGVDVATAVERVLASPPPIGEPSPFSGEDERGRLATTAQIARALAELAEWASPEKMDHALLVLSVPRDTIDATFVRVLERAVEHGLALPASLGDRALGAGIADDAGALVARQIDAFRRTLTRPDRGGLDAESIAANWEKLLAAAADAEVAIDSETHDMAWRAIREVRGEQTGSMPGGALDPARIAEMGNPELVMLLEHPRHRRVAALALADRGDPELADALCKAVRKMPRAEVVRVVPRITRLGDEAGDALIDGLNSRKTFARQAFALALGHLKLRRAVVPLLHLIGSETTDVWREVARIYGTFGNASFRTLSQKLHDPKAPEERYVLTLAHLANHGCAKQVEALAKDSDKRVAAMATRALGMRDDARRQHESVSGARPLENDDGVLAFSRRFVQELEGTAPEGDLATLPGEDA